MSCRLPATPVHSPPAVLSDRRTRCTRCRHLSTCSHLQSPFWKNCSITLAEDCVTKLIGPLNWDTSHWRSPPLRSKFNMPAHIPIT